MLAIDIFIPSKILPSPNNIEEIVVQITMYPQSTYTVSSIQSPKQLLLLLLVVVVVVAVE